MSIHQPFLKCRVYPSGDYSVGFVPRKKVSVVDTRYEREVAALDPDQKVLEVDKERSDYFAWRLSSPGFPIGLSDASNSHKNPERRGLTGITTYGRRIIRSGATLLEAEYGKNRLGFGTVTLPPMDRESLKNVIGEWSEVTRQFIQNVRRHLSKHGVTSKICYVTELQENRYFRTGLPFPHLHFLYVCHKGDYQWFITAAKFRSLWKRAVEKVCEGDSIRVDAAVDVKPLKKSAAGYLSKYMSKGGKIIEDVLANLGAEFLPCSWWGCSQELKHQVKESIIEDVSVVAEFLWEEGRKLVECGLAFFGHVVEIHSPLQGRKVVVGYFGALNRSGMRFVSELLQGATMSASMSA